MSRVRIQATISGEELAALKRAAEAAGLSVSDALARAARREIVRMSLAPADLVKMQMKALATRGVTAADLKAAVRSPTTVTAEQLKSYIEGKAEWPTTAPPLQRRK